MRQRLTALIVAGVLAMFALPAATTAAECQFILGFATLKALIDAAEGPDKVGDCLENQRFNPENGDALQQTTGGLLVWRKADNWTAFTDGYRTWINGPYGLQSRLNTEQFDWEGPPQASPVPTVEIGTEYTAQCSNGIVVPNPQGNPGLVTDCAALLQSLDTLAGATKLNWSVDRAIPDWAGIIVSGSPRRVTALDLSELQLTGPIPPQLGALANLQQLWLGGNQLTGPIPPQLGMLANLEWLRLGGNQLTGHIPPELGSLTNLWRLELHRNQLTGPVPPELGNLANMWVLYLNNNQLTGPIPLELGNLANLRELILSYNQLAGPIPPELGALTNLQWLFLSHNTLTGTIPSQLGTLTNLQGLRLTGNALTGCLPPGLHSVTRNDFAELGLPFCRS